MTSKYFSIWLNVKQKITFCESQNVDKFNDRTTDAEVTML